MPQAQGVRVVELAYLLLLMRIVSSEGTVKLINTISRRNGTRSYIEA
jgi:hypothetical protein